MHTIGVGTSEGALLPLGGGGDGFKLDEDGKPVLSRLQPALLRRVAETTGGVYLERGSDRRRGDSRSSMRCRASPRARWEPSWFASSRSASSGSSASRSAALLLALATSPFRRQEAAA